MFGILSQYGDILVWCDSIDLICPEKGYNEEYLVRSWNSLTGETIQGFYSTKAKAEKVIAQILKFNSERELEKVFQLPLDEEVEL